MRNLYICALASAFAATAAQAADIPSRKDAPSYLSPAPVASWTGFYVGVYGGYGGGSAKSSFNVIGAGLFQNGTNEVPLQGFVAGGALGYNMQFANNVVAGLEADIGWNGVQNKNQGSGTTIVGGVVSLNDGRSPTSFGFYSSIRGRLGYAFGSFMPFVTGGVAITRVSASVNNSMVTIGLGGAFSATTGSASATRAGWTLGAGAEYAITPSWSFKTEYLYSQFAGVSVPVFGIPAGPISMTNTTGTIGLHQVRAGLNYRFGFGGAPVMAKF